MLSQSKCIQVHIWQTQINVSLWRCNIADATVNMICLAKTRQRLERIVYIMHIQQRFANDGPYISSPITFLFLHLIDTS